mgnify:CR=1 FL=1
MGIIYAMTNTIIEIDRLKTEINDAKKSNDDKRLKRLLKELDEWVSVADELRRKGPELFDTLVEKLRGRDHEKELSLLMKAYEERMRTQVTFRGRKHTIRGHMRLQTERLASAVMGKLEYRPFRVRW